MSKQPYIPFYIGDYIRDTRMLPLNIRGGWIEIFIQSWNTGGEITATIDEFARLLSCGVDEAILVIQTLKQKNICDYAELENGVIKITSRKIKKLLDLSEKRKNAGSLGGNPKLVKQKKKLGKARGKPNPEYENESNIPLKEEFLNYCKEILKDKYQPLEFSLIAKYDTWISDKWNDGNGKPIIVWKNAIRNVIPHLKPMKGERGEAPKTLPEAKVHN